MDRREFIKDLAALGVAAGVARVSGVVPPSWAAPEKGQVPYRPKFFQARHIIL